MPGHQAACERAPAVPGLEATPVPHALALAGSTGWLRGVSLTLPHPPPCEPGFHCREHIRWSAGVKKSHISLYMQLCPCLQVPALRAAFLYGDTAPASLPEATHTSQARSTDGAALDQPVPLWADTDSGSPRSVQKGEEKGKPYFNKYLKFSTDTIMGFQATESFFFSFPETHNHI